MHPLFLTSFCGDQVLGRSVTPLRALLTGPSASLVPPKIPPISPSTSRFPSPTKQSEPGQMHQQWSDLARGRIYVVRRRCLIGWWCSNLTKCQSSVSDGKWTRFPLYSMGFFFCLAIFPSFLSRINLTAQSVRVIPLWKSNFFCNLGYENKTFWRGARSWIWIFSMMTIPNVGVLYARLWEPSVFQWHFRWYCISDIVS